jgi:hypothetical protein
VLALLVREIDGISLGSLAHFLKREASGLSKLANRLQIKCLWKNSLENDLREMREYIFETD